ncbi:MAG: sulfurtransferase [Anaerolineales bacterium]|nr:sulfurtransferase [Anaerolineales bacterium]
MSYQTLVDVDTLATHLENPDWVIVDCRFSLADTSAGQRAYEAAHILGAVYAHLDHDLSGPPVTDAGRHPLPTPAALTDLFGRLGIDAQKQVVAYDDAGGMIASRLWWMLHYMGHENTAVLDGGWPTWQTQNLPVRSGNEQNSPTLFIGEPNHSWLVQLHEVPQQPLLVDSRGRDRYRGENETIDPRAGHIPHAHSLPFAERLTPDGHMLPVATLQAQFADLLQDTPAAQATFYCGSGVSACVNLLALRHAGLGMARLYVGSWSEWSQDPQRTAVVGDTPI